MRNLKLLSLKFIKLGEAQPGQSPDLLALLALISLLITWAKPNSLEACKIGS